MRAAVLVVVAACTAGEPKHYTRDTELSPVFRFHAWFGWSAQQSPDVTAVAIDGTAVPSDANYQVSEWFTSYDDALAQYVPRTVVVTTMTGTLTTSIAIGDSQTGSRQCKDAAGDQGAWSAHWRGRY
jgi:hypothetical protein